ALCCTDFKVGADLSGVDFGVDASIKGQFTAFAQASGACTAEGCGAVDCQGKCDGSCQGSTDEGGNCNGKCNGTCTAKADAPAIKCSGSCKGTCNAKCEAKAGATVKCDGKCEGTAQPLSCKGGELKAQCQADANCSGNCKASASAKAECTPPKVDITFAGSAAASASAEAALVVEALRLHLPEILLVFQARGQAFVDLSGKVVASGAATLNPGKLGVKGTACLAAIVPVVTQAGLNVKGAVEASASIAGEFKLN
ncbi:MAG TPA: hypothetical protein VM925_12035, partial [Labilithrix sp.]|nr:hypothetical protein [Labilithrix sp.]